MSSTIRTYNDLLVERERLENLLVSKKKELKTNIELLKEQYKPVFKAASFVRDLTTKDRSHPWLNMAVSLLIDILVKGKLLRKASWIYKIGVPFVLKNYASNLFGKKNKTEAE